LLEEVCKGTRLLKVAILTDDEVLAICKETHSDSKSGTIENFWDIVHMLLIRQERKTLTELHKKINAMKRN